MTLGAENRKTHTSVRRALSSPADEVIPHPVLDVPVEEAAYTRSRGVDWVVFGVTAVIAVGFLVWGFVSTPSLANASGSALTWVMDNTGWLFVLTGSGFVVFVLWLALGRYGTIPLGRDDEEPEFNGVSWVAMMFSAGMGIGLMFFGVAEPLTHFATPPPGTGAAGNPEAVQTAMATTLFHWTLHPWAIYAVVGLAIAYGVYRKGRLQLISAAFEPLLGSRANGPWGKVIDMLAIFATLVRVGCITWVGGVADSQRPADRRRHRRDRQHDPDRDHHRAHRRLRAVRCFGNRAGHPVAVEHQHGAGPGAGVVRIRRRPNGFHPQLDADRNRPAIWADIAMMSARTGAEGVDVNTWLQSWTIFYWAWWVSWTPFVGMFIARISRGRTIRQFVAGVLLVPSVVSLVWFAVFGGAAIKSSRAAVDLAGEGSIEAQLFGLLDQYPIAMIASVLVMVLVAIFFVSGADAASIVMGSLSERGNHQAGPGHRHLLGCRDGRGRGGDAAGRR